MTDILHKKIFCFVIMLLYCIFCCNEHIPQNLPVDYLHAVTSQQSWRLGEWGRGGVHKDNGSLHIRVWGLGWARLKWSDMVFAQMCGSKVPSGDPGPRPEAKCFGAEPPVAWQGTK